MDVIKKNLIAVVPQFSESLENCDFVSFDCEFTGLSDSLSSNPYLFDHEQYYKMSRNNVMKFQIIQVGLSTFKAVDKRKFECNSYNFYIFPTKYLKERFFLCQSSSLQFLANSGFDFNKLFKEGISYVPLSEESKFQAKFSNQDQELAYKNDEEKQIIEGVLNQIQSFVKDSTDELGEL